MTEICEAFLVNPQQFPPELINKLRSTIQELLKCCSFALRLSERLGGTDQEVRIFDVNISFCNPLTFLLVWGIFRDSTPT